MNIKKQNSLILGIDTSCDETSVAILKDGNQLLSNIISSQVKIHQPHGGVVPELASRSHLENLPLVVDQALKEANCTLKELTGIAVTTSPGLIGCLLVGLSYAKSLAYSLKIPLTCVHHLKGHLFSLFLENQEIYPFLGLVVSGGHTALYYVKSFNEIECVGQTVDDAAGEAYDKVAKLLGLGYPGGPLVDCLAGQGDDHAYSFTRAKVKKGPLYFSFSGLKTAVLFLTKKLGPALSEEITSNICASFQKEVSDYLLEKVDLALKKYPSRAVLLSGGVAMNSLLRKKLELFCKELNITYLAPGPKLCMDNGAMIAYVGARQLEQGKVAPLDCNAYASMAMW